MALTTSQSTDGFPSKSDILGTVYAKMGVP